MDAIIVALIGAAVSLLGVYVNDKRVARKDTHKNTLDLTKVTLEAEISRESLVNEATEKMFDRLQGQIDALSLRVDDLEETERKMLAWMHMNGLGWPPPRDVYDSL